MFSNFDDNSEDLEPKKNLSKKRKAEDQKLPPQKKRKKTKSDTRNAKDSGNREGTIKSKNNQFVDSDGNLIPAGEDIWTIVNFKTKLYFRCWKDDSVEQVWILEKFKHVNSRPNWTEIEYSKLTRSRKLVILSPKMQSMTDVIDIKKSELLKDKIIMWNGFLRKGCIYLFQENGKLSIKGLEAGQWIATYSAASAFIDRQKKDVKNETHQANDALAENIETDESNMNTNVIAPQSAQTFTVTDELPPPKFSLKLGRFFVLTARGKNPEQTEKLVTTTSTVNIPSTSRTPSSPYSFFNASPNREEKEDEYVSPKPPRTP